jgi:hypothetical protein
MQAFFFFFQQTQAKKANENSPQTSTKKRSGQISHKLEFSLQQPT